MKMKTEKNPNLEREEGILKFWLTSYIGACLSTYNKHYPFIASPYYIQLLRKTTVSHLGKLKPVWALIYIKLIS